MRPRLRLVTACLAMLVASTAMAEPIGRYFYVAPFGGYTIFDGTQRFPTFRLTDKPNYGGRVGYRVWPWIGLELAGGFTPTGEDFTGGRDVSFIHASADLALTPYSGRYGGPFLLVGGGGSRLKTDNVSGLPSATLVEVKQLNLELGGGLLFWLNDEWGIRVEARDMAWLPRDHIRKIASHTMTFGGGVNYAIGATPRDTDSDGVPDRRDKCPNTPRGAHVDDNGCPVDADGDGVFDGLDLCPDTPKGATIDEKGCPKDSDGDGVLDGLDQCADTPKGATVDEKGCTRDSDGDGVLDGLDQCPDTPKGATIDEKGCPKDSDGDGVFDGLDKCPDTASGLKVDKDGCPIEVTERETELLDTGMIRLQDINFATGKADLPPEALPQLDIVGQVLSKWPELRIEIGGHTDSRGSDANNRKLSESRVKSVLDYLLQKFPTLKPEQYTAKGYGESQPLVPNNNALNMAKNRRVEFKVMNAEVLKREVERRKMLQK